MKPMLYEVVQNNLEVQKALTRLAGAESDYYRKLSTYVLYHPNSRILIKLPRSLRKLALLFEIREILPVSIRLEVENLYHQKMAHISKEELVQLSKLTRYLTGVGDHRFITGRAPELILEGLDEIRLSIKQPSRPKRTQRFRGYKDGRGSSSEQSRKDSFARRWADRIALREKQYLYNEAAKAEIAAAEVILARERSGESAQAIGGNPSAAQENAEELCLLRDASQSTGSCEHFEECRRNSLLRMAHALDPSCSSCSLVSKR